MEGTDDVLANLDVIQNNISSSNTSADIASVQYVCKNVQEYALSSDKNTKIMVKCLNILHDSILLLSPQSKDEEYLHSVVKGILNCLFVNDLYRMVDSVVLELAEDLKLLNIIMKVIDEYRNAENNPDDVITRFNRLHAKLEKKSRAEVIEQNLSSRINLNLSLNESPRPNDMLTIKRMPNKAEVGGVGITPRVLNVSFLPQSLTEQWALAKTPEEVSMVLDGIILMYGSLSEDEKSVAAQDTSKIIRQTLSTLKYDVTPVVVNSLKLLEAVASDHAKEFISDLGALFPRIQRYMDDPKVAIRHHALKLGGALVVRLPFDIVGRFVFACIEYKPAHPDISLKLAALSLLSIPPSFSMSSNPLLSRIMMIAGEYVDSSAKSHDSSHVSAAVDVAKDTIALALMTLCFSAQHSQHDDSLPVSHFKNVEEMLPLKLSTILGIPPQSSLSIEICRRAKCSDFPSLRQDSYLAGLATIAMEASLVSQNSATSITTSAVLSSPDSRKKPNMSIKIPEFAVTPIKTKNNANVADDSPARHMNFAHVNGNGVSVLNGNSEDMSSAPTMESYQPSWTPNDSEKPIDNSSPWAHSSQLIPSSPITTPLDRSKLKSIKKGRKPGSRLRARTADEALIQDDLSMTVELAKMPATAGNDSVGPLTGVDNRSSGMARGSTGCGAGGGALTPVEIGFYSNDGTRSSRMEQQQQQIQKIKISGRRGSRASKIPQQEDLASADPEFFSARGFKKMETLEFSSDSDSEQGGTTSKQNSKSLSRKIGNRREKVMDDDPFGTRGGGLCHSDEENGDDAKTRRVPKDSSVQRLNDGDDEVKRDDEVKTHSTNRQRNVPSLDLGGDFSIQGSSYQRQNSGGIIESKYESNVDGGSNKAVNSGNNSKPIGVKRNLAGSLKSNGGNSGSGSGSQSNMSGLKISTSGGGNSGGGSGSTASNGNELSVVVNQAEQPTGQDAFDYLERDQLEACTKPSREITKAVKELTTADWPDIFYLLNTTRRLFIHHGAEVVSSGQLHAIALGLIKQAHNLRSAVAKNAILAIEDMFFGLRHKADGEVKSISAALIKRCADSSVFITDAVDDCMVTMIRNTTVSRTLMALLAGLDNRNQVIRGKVSNYLVEMVLSMSNELYGLTKELDTLMLKLSKLTQDSSPEARMNSREIIRLMITNGTISRQHMESTLSPDIVAKSMAPQPSPKVSTLSSPLHRVKRTFSTTRRGSPLASSLKRNAAPTYDSGGDSDSYTPTGRNSSPMNSSDKISTDTNGNLCVAGVSPRATGKDNGDGPPLFKGIASRGKSNMATPKASTKKMSQNSQDCFTELVELPALLLNLSNKNWQERRDAVTHLTDHVLQHYDVLDSAGKVTHCVERIIEIFEDGSVKVVQHAIACIKKIHLEKSSLLPNMVLTSLPAVLNISSSANKQINAQGSQLLKMLLKVAPPTVVPQQLVSQALHDKDRLKAEAFRAMCYYIHIMHNNEIENDVMDGSDRHGVMKSVFFPAAVKTLCLSTAKPEVRTAAADTLRSIQDKVNEYIEDWTQQPLQQNELKRILG